MKRTLSILLVFVMTLSLLTGCGSSSKAEYDNFYAADMETVAAGRAPMEGADSLTSSSQLDSTVSADRKLIKTVYLSAETEHYDDLIAGLNDTITALGGYVESREISGSRSRRCSMTIRIPAESLELFVTHVRENANVTSSSETAQDVTLEYVDTEAKIKALETEQSRLLELLSAAQNLSEILEIEARLSDVTYELERYASRLRSLSNLVTYATVNLSVWEVEVLTPVDDPTVWERITSGFAESLEDLGEDLTDIFVWIIVSSPYLAVWGIVITVAVFLIRRGKQGKTKKEKKIRGKNAQNPSEPPAES